MNSLNKLLSHEKDSSEQSPYKDTIIPKKYNGMIARPDKTTLDTITNTMNISDNIANQIPGDATKMLHNKLEFKPLQQEAPTANITTQTKQIEVKKPSIFKRIINTLTSLASSPKPKKEPTVPQPKNTEKALHVYHTN